ncbi:hypothetical protein [Nocardiopsis valliformis]|uniref:hypothetical protein n=1 Tax=Nocardiopsis valliformis TaxID=239974 RepID=UPI001267E721|nr:hypothetical protein [Nocardiopsis valliformis]
MDYSEWLVATFSSSLPDVGSIDVPALENGLGASFPQDYLRVMRSLPQFSLDEYIGIMGPESLVRSHPPAQEALRRAFEGEEGFYVDDGYGHASVVNQGEFIRFSELLKFGSTSTSSSLYWQMVEGCSDDWPVLVGSKGVWYKYNVNFSEFLYRVLHGSISCPLLVDEDWPDDEIEADVWR